MQSQMSCFGYGAISNLKKLTEAPEMNMLSLVNLYFGPEFPCKQHG